MSTLTLQRKQISKISIPYWIFINGQFIGVMQSKEVCIQIPEGTYELGIKIPLKFFKWQSYIGGFTILHILDGKNLHLKITDKEKWWNLLFDIDIVFWLAEFFIKLPYPWNIVYQVLSDGFFIIWIIRILIIRKRYFQIIEKS